ncbi:MAG TPA: response regulator, partial [Methanomicrobiales archaeon]|nr:response regulator [Methanomicrobiales archaeon]
MSKIRVLVVDDSIFMRTIIRDMLEKDDRIEVIGTAFDGLDALKKIEELSPDIVTLDIEMPRMDGFSVLERLHSLPSSPKTLILSSLTTRDAEMTRRALILGADDFMFKPKDIQETRGIESELLAKIENLMQIPAFLKHEHGRGGAADTLVVIGSSAGGPPMLDRLLSSLPASLPAAVVITQ